MIAASDPPNLPMLIKLLKMTTSSNDSEALVAIRKANESLARFGGDWETLLRGKITIIGDPFANIPTPAKAGFAPKASPPPPPPPPRNDPPFRGAAPRYNPPPPPPGPQPKNKWDKDKKITNKFDGRCSKCSRPVEAGKGYAIKKIGDYKWRTECVPCNFGTTSPPTDLA